MLSKAKRAPRPTKKAQQEADFKHRVAYAEQLFTELNGEVFDNGIPNDTTLKWNKRMSSTAGKASWHKFVLQFFDERLLSKVLLGLQNVGRLAR
jgi:hypothetical protein